MTVDIHVCSMSNLLVLEAILTGGSILEIITYLHSPHYFILMIAQGREREGQMEIYFLSAVSRPLLFIQVLADAIYGSFVNLF